MKQASSLALRLTQIAGRAGQRVSFNHDEVLAAHEKERQLERADRMAARRNAEAKKMSEVMGHTGIPPRFHDCGFNNYEILYDKQRPVVDACIEYVKDFSQHKARGEGLLMVGTNGTGKNHLACAICHNLIHRGRSVLFATALEALQIIKDSYRKDSTVSEREAIRQFLRPDLLVLDEVGVQHGTPAERMLLTEMVNQRYAHNKPMILISNLTPKQLSELLGIRIFSRLQEVNQLLDCKWEDYRARSH